MLYSVIYVILESAERSVPAGLTDYWQVKTLAAGKGRNQNTKGRGRRPSGGGRKAAVENTQVWDEISLIGILAAAVLLFLCNFGVIGPVGNAVSGFLFGIFGLAAYAIPVLIFLATAFHLANKGESIATIKLWAGVVLVILIGIVIDMMGGISLLSEEYDLRAFYAAGSEEKRGGGILFGSLAYLLNHLLDRTGTMLVIVVLAIICIVVITEKSLLRGVEKGSRRVYESALEEGSRRRERNERRREEQLRRREEAERLQEERRLKEEEEEQEKILRMDKKVSGVMLDTTIGKEKEKNETVQMHRDDIHEITLTEPEAEAEHIRIHTAQQMPEMGEINETAEPPYEEGIQQEASIKADENHFAINPEKVRPKAVAPTPPKADASFAMPADMAALEVKPYQPDMEKNQEKAKENLSPVKKGETQRERKYQFPPISLLQKGSNKGSGDTASQLKETALRLQQTLQTFGVKVTVTDISQGPAVTRYELQPEAGVKVSRIVNLADDIKLNLAATDIRIEAPIPGKAAVGIEVPNKENATVALRDLIESAEFKNFSANLAFAVGKDIGGKTVVADIAKMPHMLIAGATGSGKSVCINTLIMSILYKASPEDVKMIMVDPKVVELSVYNGIPHLLVPVVTDPKKAAAALHWGVAEMTDRYKKFADFNVRDLKGYNKKVESMKGDPEAPAKMPQIVIIVDELADLMMVSPGEVEESICRLAQLARAAGIHLIIATQRPSVDVITGLIKANMPSRVAFAVSSGVDSRTILDMNGAEKLLGKGDMLFYPQGYPKPARIQGAFVSDKEVGDVVDFLKNQAIGNVYAEDIEEKIQTLGGTGGAAGGGPSQKDDYFVDAGKFIIDKDKASIGLLQRAFKIGFNRAARIMDQLYEAGVVGEEEGTKPRKILMSMEEFEQYIEDYV